MTSIYPRLVRRLHPKSLALLSAMIVCAVDPVFAIAAAPEVAIETPKTALRADGLDTATIRVRTTAVSGTNPRRNYQISVIQGEATLNGNSQIQAYPWDEVLFRVTLKGTQDAVLEIQVDSQPMGSVSLRAIAPREPQVPRDALDCARSLQLRNPRFVSGLPFGNEGWLSARAPISEFMRLFPDLEDGALLVKENSAYKVRFPSVGMYAPGGDLVGDTFQLRIGGDTYFVRKDVTGGIGAAWNTQKQPMRPDETETWSQPAYQWYAQKLTRLTGKDHLVAEPVPLSEVGKVAELLSAYANEHGLGLKYRVRDERIQDSANLTALLDMISSPACVQVRTLDGARDQWGQAVLDQFRMGRRSPASTGPKRPLERSRKGSKSSR